jgi:hypothetical protein
LLILCIFCHINSEIIVKKLFWPLILLLILLLTATLASLWYLRGNLFPPEQKVQTHTVVLKEIEGLGRMELVRYHFQDMVKHEVIREWWPDPKVLLFVYGEAVGCIDFTQIDSSDVVITGDTLHITLPEPELCYVRIDHERSRLYYTQFTFWEEADLVSEAYQVAERQIRQSALQADILGNTRLQAETMLVPMLELLSGGNKVFIRFEAPPLPRPIRP